MNFLCNINQSFADLLINYLNLIKERSSCLTVWRCSVKKVFLEILQNFEEYLFSKILTGVDISHYSRRDLKSVAFLVSLQMLFSFSRESNFSILDFQTS